MIAQRGAVLAAWIRCRRMSRGIGAAIEARAVRGRVGLVSCDLLLWGFAGSQRLVGGPAHERRDRSGVVVRRRWDHGANGGAVVR